ncbi:siderophore-interacting protein [Sphingomonas gei]|nr:siderophore-interacting protein [Sphingomonas gei]
MVITTSAPRQPGRLTKALTRMFMKHATVESVEPIAESFYWITLESAAFRGVAWTPGHKIQIMLGWAFASRTYTPVEWDAAAGRTRFLAYAHGVGPGSDWVRTLKAGDECDVFGPRASLDVSRLSGPVLLFGDETSFGLALAMSRLPYAGAVRVAFEVKSVETSERALAHLDLAAWRPLARRDDDSHLQEMEALLPGLARSNATFVLTGRSTSLQRVRQALKGLDVPATRLMTKAYWAPGKAGLD